MALIGRANRFRYPITAIAVVGLGALVALSVGLSLYLGLSSAAENTRRLMAQRSETLVNDLDRRITSQLQPVVRQARWAVEQIERGNVKMEDAQALNTFMRFVLGATPHLAEIAITDPRARSRRWTGTSAQPLVEEEEWSERPDVTAWLEARASRTGPRWRAPLWSATLGTTVLHLDTPIRIDGTFAGVFSQAVTISDLSLHIASVGAETGVIPFILYGPDHVLAHPLLISWTPSVTDRDHPLVALDALGDAVLKRIWAPGNHELYLLGGMTEASSSRVTVGEDLYVFLYRDIDQFGPQPWTIGAYVRFGTSDLGKWLADIVRAAMSGSFENTGTIHGNEFERVVAAVLAGLAVLVLSVALAAWVGTRASGPIRALAAAARCIEAQGLDRVRPLPPSRVAEFDDANRSFNRMVAGLKESVLVRETLGRFVPTDVARTLLTEGGELSPRQSEATVLFCDLEGFTALTEILGPDGIVELLNEYFEVMVGILERYRYDSDAPHCSPSEHAPLSIHLRSALPAFRSRPPRSKDHALVRTDHLRPQSQASRANVMNVAGRRRQELCDWSILPINAQSCTEIESYRTRVPTIPGCEFLPATVLPAHAQVKYSKRFRVAYGQRRSPNGAPPPYVSFRDPCSIYRQTLRPMAHRCRDGQSDPDAGRPTGVMRQLGSW